MASRNGGKSTSLQTGASSRRRLPLLSMTEQTETRKLFRSVRLEFSVRPPAINQSLPALGFERSPDASGWALSEKTFSQDHWSRAQRIASSRRSSPQKTSSFTTKVGEPNTPSSIASSVEAAINNLVALIQRFNTEHPLETVLSRADFLRR